MPFSFLPQLKGDAIRLQNFFRRLVAEVSSPLIRCFRAPEQSAIFDPANPGDRVLTIGLVDLANELETQKVHFQSITDGVDTKTPGQGASFFT